MFTSLARTEAAPSSWGLRRLRHYVPQPVQPVARAVLLRHGVATSRFRMKPSFIVIGAQRCGTTSIFKHLAEHPQIMRPPVEKGTDYYTLHFGKGLSWYQGHFPLRVSARLQSRGSTKPVAFEACTYYMFHPFALERLARDFPEIKLVAMLRDPVERAYSAYKHELGRGFETETDFMRALDLEGPRLEDEIGRMKADVRYESHAHRHQAYVRRGQYAEQLERAFSWFSRDQVHVMDSEAFFLEPAEQYAQLIEFLELDSFRPSRFEQHNARPSSPMPIAARQRLAEHFEPWDSRLEELLGRRVTWRRSGL